MQKNPFNNANIIVDTYDVYAKTGSLMGVPANGESEAPIDISKSGYTPIFAEVEVSGSVTCMVYKQQLSGNYFTIGLHNVGTSRVDVNPYFRVVYKEG